ncbi:SCO6745 family protein [Streptomyces sp. URMC 126]|uniref:SCO6745 family protein n=1 Tax=Streptomyces sp. URMC 126 TaxID=3423401 RepID=UPI003F1E0579
MDDAAATPPETVARTLWRLAEPVHAVTYFAPEARAAYEEAGLHGWPRGYFAGRAAPFGPVGPEPVAASFFGFAPAAVAAALPSVWEVVSPGRALELRRAGARNALRRLLAGLDEEVGRAAGLLADRVRELDCGGRVLSAANMALGFPVDPLDRLWHAATLLREHRGDGHVAALVAADLDGCESLVLRAGIDVPRSELQPYRGWTDEEWAAAVHRLAARGLLAPDGTATEEGRRLHASVEAATDRAASRPWRTTDPAELRTLTDALTPLSHACARTLRFPNPIGLPEPAPAAR